MNPLAKTAIEAVEKGDTVFYPERWKKVYDNWMHNIKDWCISRQIWWGHRIPVYYCRECGDVFASVDEPERCTSCGNGDLSQDEDVLDTWFSSQLWPFSTLGWPQESDDLRYYYPTAVLVTDPGILFFWVARMVMSGLKFMKKTPFRDVYIHGVVMDSRGRKMSKSLGNGIDPLEVVERYGADAMRFTIVNITPLGQNLLLSMDKFNVGARFANKIWNASRYILMNIEGTKPQKVKADQLQLDTADKWIMTCFEQTVQRVNLALTQYRLNEASSIVYEFFWHEFCDWYIEISKVKLYSGDEEKRARAASLILTILEGCMRLLHPFMPFITEEIWQLLPVEKSAKSIMISDYPSFNKKNVHPESIAEIEALKEICYNIRNIRGEMNVPPDLEVTVLIKTSSEFVEKLIEENGGIIRFLSKLGELVSGKNIEKPESSASAVGSGYELYLPLKGLIDIEKEKSRLSRELQKLEEEIAKSVKKLKTPDFLEKAPDSVIETEKQRLQTHEKSCTRLKGLIGSLSQ
jgi:valyl-tRNA synthetase